MGVKHIVPLSPQMRAYARLACVELPEESREFAERNRTEIGSLETILDELNEDNLALAFVERHKYNLRYCHTRKAWFEWDGSRWKQEKTGLAFHFARVLIREHNRQQKKECKTIAGVRTAGAVEKYATTDRHMAVTEELWNTDPWLLATPEGTIDLRTGKARDPDPSNHITLCTTVGLEYGEPVLWLQFLDQATNGNRDLQRFLQQMAGYCLTGITREHALFFLYGPGGNGKGVFVNTISKVMGEYATSAPMSTFTATRHDQHPTDLADLAGSRMVTASETEEGRAWAESRIKQMSGGDPVKARFMKKDFFEYTPEYKLVFLGNHKPVLKNVDDAARRRFNIVPFTFKPEKPDFELENKLESEHGRILSWMVEGCLDWQQNGLLRPAIVTEATAEYFDEQDLFAQWLEVCTEKKTERIGESTKVLYYSWKKYAEAAGDNPGSQKSFRDSMRQHGYVYVKHLPNDNSKSGFIGISVLVKIDTYRAYAD